MAGQFAGRHHLANGGDEEAQAAPAAEAKLTGLIPTGWYPNSVSVRADARCFMSSTGKSNTGASATELHGVAGATKGDFSACGAANQYVWQIDQAGFLTCRCRADKICRAYRTGGQNNNYSAQQNVADADMMRFLRGKISTSFTSLKRTAPTTSSGRSWDKGNGDPSIVVYPQPLAPNLHALANTSSTGQLLRRGEVSR